MVDPVGNFEIAAALGIAGIAVFPAQTAGDDRKKPQPGVMWRGASTTDEAGIRRFWQRYPDAAPAMDLRKTPFLVIDCDAGGKVAGQRPGREWLAEACERHDYPIERIPIVVTPSGGWHCYFRQRPGEKLGNSRGILPPKAEVDMDVRGAGGYVIAPGAVLDIGDYHYLDDNCTIEDAPELPAWLAEILRGEGGRPSEAELPISQPCQEVKPAGPTPADYQNRPPIMHDPMQERARAEAYAERALDDECAQVRSAPKGGRNTQLNQSALKLGHYVGGGHLAEGQVVAALTAAARDAGLNAPETAKTIRSGLEAGKRSPKDPPAREVDHGAAELARQVVAAYDGTLHDVETGEVFDHHEAEDAAPEDFPDHLTRPPGLLGAMVDHIEGTMEVPSRLLALTGAIALGATIIGRHWCVQAGTRQTYSNLYMVGLCRSGFGKTDIINCVRNLIIDAVGAPAGHGTTSFLGGDNIASSAGFRREMETCPVRLFTTDEVGRFVQAANNHRAGSHLKEIMTMLMTFFSLAPSVFTGVAYAERRTAPIPNPCAILLGYSTVDDWWDAFTMDAVKSGLLPRFLVVHERAKPELRPVHVDEVGRARLLTSIRRVIDRRGTEQVMSAGNMSGEFATVPTVVPMAPAAEAMRVRMRFEEVALADAMEDARNPCGPIWRRRTEMALKLALIAAVCRDCAAPYLHEADLAWAYEVVGWIMRDTERTLTTRGFVSDEQSRMQRERLDYLTRMIEEFRPRGWITRRQIVNRLKNRGMDGRTIDGLIDIELQGGSIAIKAGCSEKRKAEIVYTIQEHAR